MRALFTTTGQSGHLLPLVPFARALVRAGHEVLVAAPRSRGGDVVRAGLALAPFADQPADEAVEITRSTYELGPDEANARVTGEIFGRLDTRAALPGLLETAEAWRPDVIVHETYEFASLLVAERLGIPHARVATGLAAWERRAIAWAAPAVDAVRADLGLPRDPDGHAIRSAPYLTLTPPALDTPSPPAAHRFRHEAAPVRIATAANGAPPPLPGWWPGRGEPLVYVTFGSVAGALPFFPGLYRAAIDALADRPVRVLVTIGAAGDPADLGALPANVHVERWVPQEQVLPYAAAMVCHGGFGSTTGALAGGLPLVVVPLFADQMHNARRVAEAGAGIALPPFASIRAAVEEGPTALAELGPAVRAVLETPAYGRAAARIAAGAAALPPVDAAVDVLAEIAAEPRRLSRAA